MDEDNILGITVIVSIFGILICCSIVFICRTFACVDNYMIINHRNLLNNQSDDIYLIEANIN